MRFFTQTIRIFNIVRLIIDPFLSMSNLIRKHMNTTARAMIAAAAMMFATQAQAAEIPQSAELKYSGSYGIPATMTFKRTGNNYTVTANINVPMYKMRFVSGGSIVDNQLKPSYYKDIRNGKTYAEAKFSGNQITLGKAGELHNETVSGPVMDLFTLSWQLALNEGKLPVGLKITNGKKLYSASGLTKTGTATQSIAGGKTTVNKYSLRRGDSTAAYAFAPNLGNVPAQINYSDDGKNYNLKLTSVKINGKTIKP